MNKVTQSEEARMQIVSQNISHLLDARNWTWSKLAQEAGLTQPTISHIKRAKIDPGFLKMLAIAEALGTTTDWLSIRHETTKSRNMVSAG